MRLEGWHVMLFLAIQVLVAIAVVVVVTLLVLWTVRRARRKDSGGSGPAPP